MSVHSPKRCWNVKSAEPTLRLVPQEIAVYAVVLDPSRAVELCTNRTCLSTFGVRRTQCTKETGITTEKKFCRIQCLPVRTSEGRVSDHFVDTLELKPSCGGRQSHPTPFPYDSRGNLFAGRART